MNLVGNETVGTCFTGKSGLIERGELGRSVAKALGGFGFSSPVLLFTEVEILAGLSVSTSVSPSKPLSMACSGSKIEFGLSMAL